MNREAIYAALFAKGAGAAGFVTATRRLRHIEDLQPTEFPALYQVQMSESWAQSNSMLPPVGTLSVEWWIYVHSTDPTASHSTQLNPLIDAAMAALLLPPSATPHGKQDLSGLVESVQLAGQIQIAEGAMDDRGFARIPLVIKTTG